MSSAGDSAPCAPFEASPGAVGTCWRVRKAEDVAHEVGRRDASLGRWNGALGAGWAGAAVEEVVEEGVDVGEEEEGDVVSAASSSSALLLLASDALSSAGWRYPSNQRLKHES